MRDINEDRLSGWRVGVDALSSYWPAEERGCKPLAVTFPSTNSSLFLIGIIWMQVYHVFISIRLQSFQQSKRNKVLHRDRVILVDRFKDLGVGRGRLGDAQAYRSNVEPMIRRAITPLLIRLP